MSRIYDEYEKVCGCGKTILMITVEGKQVPLDRSAPVYRPGNSLLGEDPTSWQRVEGGGVNHFKTCPKADDYSKKGKGGGNPG